MREIAEQFEDTPPGLELTLPEQPIHLLADAERMRTLLRNLLENSAKHSLPDSHPTQILLVASSTELVLSIHDNGQGVAVADLQTIFEPFRRVDPSRSTKTGGAGLGLSICRRIVEAHGGQIHGEASGERGLVIVVTIPRQLGAEAAQPPQSRLGRGRTP